jgi:RNase H-fold protein (predicted Holliday junction resolvase)
MTAPFEILSIDLAKKRIGVALVAEEVRDDYTAAPDETSTKGFGSLADKLKGVLGPKQS